MGDLKTPKGHFEFTVHKPLFPSDPYVKIFLLHNGKRIAKKRKTNVKKRTLNPEFNETFVFDLPYSQEELKNVELNFIVFDWDRLSKNEVTYIHFWSYPPFPGITSLILNSRKSDILFLEAKNAWVQLYIIGMKFLPRLAMKSLVGIVFAIQILYL